MAKGELAPIRIPVVIDTSGLNSQLKGAESKIANSGLGRGGGIGGAGGFAGSAVGNGIGGGTGMGSSFAAAAASNAVFGRNVGYLGTVLERHAMSMSRISFQGSKIKETTKPAKSKTPTGFSIVPGNYYKPFTPIMTGLGGFGFFTPPMETTREFVQFSLSAEQAQSFSERIQGGGGGGTARRAARGRGGQRLLSGAIADELSPLFMRKNIPAPPDRGREGFGLKSIGRMIGGKYGGAIAAGAAGFGVGIAVDAAVNKISEIGNYINNYSKNMSMNTQAMAAGYLGGSLQSNALAFQKQWQTATPQPGGYWQRMMAQWRGWGVDIVMDYLATGWDIMTAPESLTPSGYQYGSQRMQEFKIRNFGSEGEKKELIRKQKRAARAAERNSV